MSLPAPGGASSAGRYTSGPTVASPLVRSPEPHSAQLSPSTSSFSRLNGPSSRMSRAPSTFSAFGESTPIRGQVNGLSQHRSYTPNPNLRHIPSSSIPASSSGGATPDYKRRAKRMAERGLIKEGEKDWGNVEPDEVFRRLPVAEVKRVEAKMRKEALDKQSDLRAMVGTRYRDLLTSATQISTLRTASLNLSDSLRTVAAACANADDIAITAETSTQGSDSEDVMTILPVAAHMKLLLDAPEALYAYLGDGEVLKAGWLWLVARVVKEGITSMGETSEVYQPLLGKQWELLVPFRAQIVQKATEKLGLKSSVETRTLAETLLTIILLENLPVSETLSLLLTQRSLALRNILAHPNTAVADSNLNTKGKDTALPDPPTSAKERDTISTVLGNAVQCLLDTSEVVNEIFSNRPNRSESLLEEMIRLVQQGEINPPTITQHTTPLRRTSSSTTHTRRASRLVSISLPFTNDPTSSSSPATTPPISTIRIIQALPSSQILLRHLPSSITGFTPFITPPQSPGLPDRLEKWQNDGVGILGKAAPAWLADIHSAQAVWAVRAILAEKLGKGEFEGKIESALEDEWGARTRGIWETGLEGLVSAVEREVGGAIEEIQTKGAESDINPEKHVFSAVTFPSIQSATLNIANPVSFPTFMAGLKKRNVYRTPLLDAVLVSLENIAKELQADVKGLPESLVVAYAGQVDVGLERMVAVLRSILKELRRESAEGSTVENRVYAELLVGRVALFLVRQSTFFQDLIGKPMRVSDPTPTALLALHSDSTSSWRTLTIIESLKHLSPLFDSHRGPREVRATWQGPYPVSPSAPVIVALHSLVKAVRHLGIPPAPADADTKAEGEIPVVRRLVEGFVDAARSLEGWAGMSEETCVQAAVDLGFLCLVRGGIVGEDEATKGMLAKIPESLQSIFPQLLSPILAESLKRVQLILHPLSTHLQPSLSPQLDLTSSSTTTKGRNGSTDARAQLLQFGAPSGRIVSSVVAIEGEAGQGEQMGTTSASSSLTDFRSPIAIAKPGKRFGLVSIVS